MDDADRAEQIEQRSRDLAIQNMKQDYTQRNLSKQADGTYRCEECGGEVPEARVIAVNASLCVGCQNSLERKGTI